MKDIEDLARFVRPSFLSQCMNDDIGYDSVFDEVMKAIQSRQAIDDQRRGKLLGGARRFRYNMSHKGEDEAQIKQLQKKIELCVSAFHVI